VEEKAALKAEKEAAKAVAKEAAKAAKQLVRDAAKAAKALAAADVVAIFGTPWDFRLQYGQAIDAGAKVIQVDLDPHVIGHNRGVDVGLNADSGLVMKQLAEAGHRVAHTTVHVHGGVGIDEQSDHSAIAAFRRPVQRGVAIAVHGGAGVRGWAPRGCPSPQPVPETQNSRLAPRVDYGFVLGNR
jgi:hypothetical protein